MFFGDFAALAKEQGSALRGGLLCPWRLVVAKSTPLRFRPTAKTAFVPLLLLFPANPFRWASPGVTRDWTKRHRGRGRRALCAHRTAFPGPRFYESANQAALIVIAKARVAQSTHRLSFFAAAGLVLIEGSTLPLLKAPLFAVGLKLCGGGGIKRKPSPLGEGAPVRTLGRMRSVHQNRLCLPPIIETGRPSVPPLRAGVVSPRRATARVAPAVLRGGV